MRNLKNSAKDKENSNKKDDDYSRLNRLVSDNIILRYSVFSGIVGIILLIFFIFFIEDEKYTILYIYPESYDNYVKTGENISFVYGIKNFEGKTTTYTLLIFLGNTKLKEEKITLNNGDFIEKKVIIKLTENYSLPTKIKIVLITQDGNIYDVYFWIKPKP